MYMFEKGGDAVSERRWEVGGRGERKRCHVGKKGFFLGCNNVMDEPQTAFQHPEWP